MFRFLDKCRYDRILHAFCINPMSTKRGIFSDLTNNFRMGDITGLSPQRSVSDNGSYVDNLSSTLYRPWQTVAYAEGERYAVLTAPDCSPTLCHSLGCAV